MIGKTISHYRILSKLGEGGMGVAYKAQACEFLWNKLVSMEDGDVLVPELKSCSTNVPAVVIGKSVRSNPEFGIIGVPVG